MDDMKRGEPLYVPDKNPHNSIVPVKTESGERTGQWECTYCHMKGTFDELNEIACTHVYPACKYCGLTPICAADCAGILGALMGDNVYIAGSGEYGGRSSE